MKEFKKELAKTQERGYAVDDEEFSERVKCVAAPIFGHKNEVKGDISITGPANRMEERGREKLVSYVKKSCKDITEKLGGKLKT